MALQSPPVAYATMLIRRPVAEVFQAVVDPAVTTQFWFSAGSGVLEEGATVRWNWDTFGLSAEVTVVEVAPEERVVTTWDDPPRTVEWRFTPRGDAATLLQVTEGGFLGTDDEVLAAVADSAGGFALVLAGMKAWLEFGIQLNLVADHHPDAGTS